VRGVNGRARFKLQTRSDLFQLHTAEIESVEEILIYCTLHTRLRNLFILIKNHHGVILISRSAEPRVVCYGDCERQLLDLSQISHSTNIKRSKKSKFSINARLNRSTALGGNRIAKIINETVCKSASESDKNSRKQGSQKR
jgi:hypothetical protein